MLIPIAATPGALDPRLYSSPEIFAAGMGSLDDLCRAEGLFLDLRGGNWSRFSQSLGTRAKQFLVFAKKEHRLVNCDPVLPTEPDEDEHWLWEAQSLASDNRTPCDLIITHRELAAVYSSEPKIVSAESLNSSAWWGSRSPSITVPRSTKNYIATLRPILQHANLLMFIDPYPEPAKENYQGFINLLLAAGTPIHQPVIQIHRASWKRNELGQKRGQLLGTWKAEFKVWDEQLEKAGLRAEVFLWNEVHNRYLISDMVGISVPNGFDDEAGKTDNWSLLGRTQRDQQIREYEPTNPLRGYCGSFELGKAI